MSAITGPRSLGLVIAVVIAVLAAGCASAKTKSPAPGQGTTASTPAPMTAADLAWIQAITERHKKIDKPFMASSMDMTRAKMNELRDSLRSCNRELSRIGYAEASAMRPVRSWSVPLRIGSRGVPKRAGSRPRGTAATFSVKPRQERRRSGLNSHNSVPPGTGRSPANKSFGYRHAGGDPSGRHESRITVGHACPSPGHGPSSPRSGRGARP